MLTCFDVAKYILEKLGPMSAMKLQKLVYYSQAWALVWDEAPLFNERIEAWMHGPVVVDLYEAHRGMFSLDKTVVWGDSSKVTINQRDTINTVLSYYGDKNPQWLSDLTHLEDPWKNARSDLAPAERGSNEISHVSMIEYYSSLHSK